MLLYARFYFPIANRYKTQIFSFGCGSSHSSVSQLKFTSLYIHINSALCPSAKTSDFSSLKIDAGCATLFRKSLFLSCSLHSHWIVLMLSVELLGTAAAGLIFHMPHSQTASSKYKVTCKHHSWDLGADLIPTKIMARSSSDWFRIRTISLEVS